MRTLQQQVTELNEICRECWNANQKCPRPRSCHIFKKITKIQQQINGTVKLEAVAEQDGKSYKVTINHYSVYSELKYKNLALQLAEQLNKYIDECTTFKPDYAEIKTIAAQELMRRNAKMLKLIQIILKKNLEMPEIFQGRQSDLEAENEYYKNIIVNSIFEKQGIRAKAVQYE